MTAKDFVSPDYQQKIINMQATVNDLIPLFQSAIDHGLPFGDHLAKLKEYKLDIDKLVEFLKL